MNEIELTVKKNIPNIFLIQLLTILLLTGCAAQLTADQNTRINSSTPSRNIVRNILQQSIIADLPPGALSRSAQMELKEGKPFMSMLPEAAQSIKKEEKERQALAIRQQQLMLEQQKFQRQIEEEALQRNLLANFLEDKDKHTAANLVRAGVPLTTAIMFEE